LLLWAALAASGAALAQADSPDAAQLLKAIAPYGEFRTSALVAWHPVGREMLVRQRVDGVEQVYRLSEPGAKLEPLASLRGPGESATWHPVSAELLTFPRANAGAWTRKGDRILFPTHVPDRKNPERIARTTLHLADPLKPDGARRVATLAGGGWSGFAFSEDDKQVAFTEHGIAGAHLWVMDVATGRKRRVTQASKEPVSYGAPRFLKDGRALLATSDRGSDYRRLTQITIADGREYPLTSRHKFDVDEFAISFDANRIAFTTNENGSHVLRFLDLATKRELTRPPLFDGVIGALQWRRKSDEVAFTISSARTAGDVFSFDAKDNKLTRWTNGNNPALNTSEFAEPRLVIWKSFDGLEVTGFHYHPPAKFAGRRPVFVNLHAGSPTQAKATFIGRNNYFVSELGIAMIYPNFRGTPGFGKAFLELGDGDAPRDLAALLDWIRAQPDLDGERVLVGSSPEGVSAREFAAGVEAARAHLLN
jgi:dipeptidyl aminopeptidase/acylaminoacyl peptidase